MEKVSTRLDTKNDFLYVIFKVKATGIDLSRFKREVVKIHGDPITVFKNLEFSRRTKYKHPTDKFVIILVSKIKYKNGTTENFIQMQYFMNGVPLTENYTTQTKREKINYYLKKKNFIRLT